MLIRLKLYVVISSISYPIQMAIPKSFSSFIHANESIWVFGLWALD